MLRESKQAASDTCCPGGLDGISEASAVIPPEIIPAFCSLVPSVPPTLLHRLHVAALDPLGAAMPSPSTLWAGSAQWLLQD